MQDQPRQPRQQPNPDKNWSRKDQFRFEDRVTLELKEVDGSLKDIRQDIEDIRADVGKLTARVAFFVGSMSVIIVIIEKVWK